MGTERCLEVHWQPNLFGKFVFHFFVTPPSILCYFCFSVLLLLICFCIFPFLIPASLVLNCWLLETTSLHAQGGGKVCVYYLSQIPQCGITLGMLLLCCLYRNPFWQKYSFICLCLYFFYFFKLRH